MHPEGGRKEKRKKEREKKERQIHAKVITDTAEEVNERVKRLPGKHGGKAAYINLSC